MRSTKHDDHNGSTVSNETDVFRLAGVADYVVPMKEPTPRRAGHTKHKTP